MALYSTTTRQEFEEKVLKSDKTVLVDFWAEWCPPCRAMAPILHDLGEELDKTVDIVKVNIEESVENQRLAQDYNISSIPNMPIFRAGKHVDTIIGMRPKSALREKLA